jgi:hypothetical protein
MTQRNPMNERYKGDGPAGKSKRSASSVKPARPVAATVWEKSKTLTPAEKRKAEKAAQRAAEEKQRLEAEKAKAEGKEAPKLPKNKEYKLEPEYRKWRKWYWGLLIAAVVSTATSFLLIYTLQVDSAFSYIPLGLAYATIIPALIIDYKKVRPFREGLVQTGDKTPKQLKHAEEAAAQAKAVEEARKASRRIKIGKKTVVAKTNKDQATTDEKDNKDKSDSTVMDSSSATSAGSEETSEK